jgi:hypothetical protein
MIEQETEKRILLVIQTGTVIIGWALPNARPSQLTRDAPHSMAIVLRPQNLCSKFPGRRVENGGRPTPLAVVLYGSGRTHSEHKSS